MTYQTKSKFWTFLWCINRRMHMNGEYSKSPNFQENMENACTNGWRGQNFWWKMSYGRIVQDCCPCEPKSPCQFPSTTWRQEKVGSQVPTKPVGALCCYLLSTSSMLLAWWEKRRFCGDSSSRLQRVRNVEFKIDNEKASFENTTISLLAGITNCTLLYWYQSRYSVEFC